jgi:hypothetical protein
MIFPPPFLSGEPALSTLEAVVRKVNDPHSIGVAARFATAYDPQEVVDS